MEENVLTQLVRDPTKADVLLELQFVNKEGLVGNEMAGGHLGHSSQEMIQVFDSQRKKGFSRILWAV